MRIAQNQRTHTSKSITVVISQSIDTHLKDHFERISIKNLIANRSQANISLQDFTRILQTLDQVLSLNQRLQRKLIIR